MHRTHIHGASLKMHRYSNLAIQRHRAHNITIEAFGLKQGNKGDTQIKTNFAEFQNIHTVTLDVGPSRQPEYYGEILK